MSHTDPIIIDTITRKLRGDSLTPAQRAEQASHAVKAEGLARVNLPKSMRTIEGLFELIEEGRAGYSEVVDYLSMIWESGVNTGREMELTFARTKLRLEAGFTDTGDGVPLAIIGPGGDFNREVTP